jgi:uncharacterized membrane protein YkgB
MAQFYFLSVLLNILIGLILVYGTDLTKENDLSSEKDVAKKNDKLFGNISCFESRSFRLVLGVLSLLVGILIILSPFRNDIPVIGDLLPALTGLVSGASLLLEYYLGSAVETSNIPGKVRQILIDGRKYIGVACLVAGLLHFTFPQVPIL